MERDIQNEVIDFLELLEIDIEWQEDSITLRAVKRLKNKVKRLKAT